MTPTKRGKAGSCERYLKLPYGILNLMGIRLIDKVLLAHFNSFGEKGCWQSNATLAEMFMASEHTISRSITSLKNAGLVTVRCAKGRYRTIWARSHPQAGRSNFAKNANQPEQNGTSNFAKTAIQVRQNCPTTNNNTNRENYGSTTATPEPLPRSAGAPALHRKVSCGFAERKADLAAKVAAFKKTFAKKPFQPVSQAEFARRRTEQRARLGCKP